MAGIGVKLNRIYHKNTITANIVGFFYSTVVTIAPVLVVILNLMLMQWVLGFNTVGYFDRELFSCTILYVFIFSLLTTAPFNAVLSRYMSDVIFEERYEDVPPCHRVGLLVNISPIFSTVSGAAEYTGTANCGTVFILFWLWRF